MIQYLVKERNINIQALILTPTRELAIQIDENIKKYSQYTSVRSGVIFGGVGQKCQVDMLKKGIDILVATPGRLNDLINQGYVKLNKVKFFVLDEADRMLDMGFIKDINKVIKILPAKRQTLLFSATMPKDIEKLASDMLRKPATVKVASVTSTIDKISQSVYYVDKKNKVLLLAYLLKNKEIKNAIVFTNTKHGADKVVKALEKNGIKALAIHGGKGQNTRQLALNNFKKGMIQALVATDIAARGIDISELSNVINYDLPDVPETYIHRIGRTGRASQEGAAINFCNFDDIQNLRDIERHIGMNLPEVKSKWPMLILEKTEKIVQQRDKRSKVDEVISKEEYAFAQREYNKKNRTHSRYKSEKYRGSK